MPDTSTPIPGDSTPTIGSPSGVATREPPDEIDASVEKLLSSIGTETALTDEASDAAADAEPAQPARAKPVYISDSGVSDEIPPSPRTAAPEFDPSKPLDDGGESAPVAAAASAADEDFSDFAGVEDILQDASAEIEVANATATEPTSPDPDATSAPSAGPASPIDAAPEDDNGLTIETQDAPPVEPQSAPVGDAPSSSADIDELDEQLAGSAEQRVVEAQAVTEDEPQFATVAQARNEHDDESIEEAVDAAAEEIDAAPPVPPPPPPTPAPAAGAAQAPSSASAAPAQRPATPAEPQGKPTLVAKTVQVEDQPPRVPVWKRAIFVPLAKASQHAVKIPAQTRQTLGYISIMTTFWALVVWGLILFRSPGAEVAERHPDAKSIEHADHAPESHGHAAPDAHAHGADHPAATTAHHKAADTSHDDDTPVANASAAHDDAHAEAEHH